MPRDTRQRGLPRALELMRRSYGHRGPGMLLLASTAAVALLVCVSIWAAAAAPPAAAACCAAPLPAMVDPIIPLQLEARARGLHLQAVYKNKNYMGVQTRIDFDSRPRYHFRDLGLHRDLLAAAMLAARPAPHATLGGGAPPHLSLSHRFWLCRASSAGTGAQARRCLHPAF